jgi:hypothetical protein
MPFTMVDEDDALGEPLSEKRADLPGLFSLLGDVPRVHPVF